MSTMARFLRAVALSAIACVAVACVALAPPALAEGRLAFVVGIDAYANLPPDAQLRRAVTDAEAVGDALQSMGFTVTRVTDGATLDRIEDAFERFTRSVQPGDTVLFYYAGHGISLSDGNYLIPADVPALGPDDERTARRHSLAEREIKQDLHAAGAKVAVVVLDACRNNPFPARGTRSLGPATRGLARVDAADGVYSLYSAREGQAALDRLSDTDTDRNSVFTRVFLKELKTPGVSLSELGDSVRDEVASLARTAGATQVPAVSNDLIGSRTVYLAGPGAGAASGLSAPAPAAVAASAAAAPAAAMAAMPPPASALPPAPVPSVLPIRVLPPAPPPAPVAAPIAAETTRHASLPSADTTVPAMPVPVPVMPAPAGGSAPSLWDHNGSDMRLIADGAKRTFVYRAPRPGMVAVGVKVGTVLFTGERSADRYRGTAYVFRRGCPPRPYDVEGNVSADERQVVVRGRAPKVADGCVVVGDVGTMLLFSLKGGGGPPASAALAPPPDDQLARFKRQLVTYFERTGASNEIAFGFLQDAYAPVVSYYGRTVDRAVVLREKQSFMVRWPQRSYLLRPDRAVTCDPGGTCRLVGVVDWRMASRSGDSAGSARVDMTWRADPDRWRIVAESSKVVARDAP